MFKGAFGSCRRGSTIRFLPIALLFLAFSIHPSDLHANGNLAAELKELDDVRRLLAEGETGDAALALATITEYESYERPDDYATYLAGEIALALSRPDVARQAFRRAWALRLVDEVPFDPRWIQRLEGRLKDLDPAVLAKQSAFSGLGAGVRAPVRALAVTGQMLYVLIDPGRLLRLGKDGSPDPAFQQMFESTAAAACTKMGEAIAATADGGAVFFCAEPMRLVKVDSTGQLDRAFGDAGTMTLNGGAVLALVVDSKARIIVAGGQSHVGGVFAPHLARLKTNGQLDRTFAPDSRALAVIRTLGVAGDDSIVAVLDIASDIKAGAPRKIFLRRFLSDGTYDQDFGRLPAASLDPDRPVSELFRSIKALGVQADGTVILVGDVPEGKDRRGLRTHLLRLSRDGRIDVGFTERLTKNLMGWMTEMIIPEPNGDVLLVGAHAMAGGRRYSNAVVRLRPDGGLDETFLEKQTDGVNGPLLAAVRGTDGTVFLGGVYGLMGPTAATRNLIRLSSDGTPSRPVTPPAFSGMASLVPSPHFYFPVEDDDIVLSSSDTGDSPQRLDGGPQSTTQLCAADMGDSARKLLKKKPRGANADDLLKRHCLVKPGSTLAVHGNGWVRHLKVAGVKVVSGGVNMDGDLDYHVVWSPAGLPGRALFATTHVSKREDSGFRKAADLEVKKAADIDRLRALLKVPPTVELYAYVDPVAGNSFVVLSHTTAPEGEEGRDIAWDAVYYVRAGRVTTLLQPQWAGGCTGNDKKILGFLDADADGNLDILVDTSGPKVILERRPRGFRPLAFGGVPCGD